MRLAAALLLFLTAGRHAAAPDVLRSTNPHRQSPLWVSSSVALTEQGELASEHFDDHAIRGLERMAEANRRRVATNAGTMGRVCFGERSAEIAVYSDSLASLTEKARSIFEGEIVGRTVGFFEDRPGALLTIRVGRVLVQRESPIVESTELFLYYPDAELTVGGETLCMQPATHPARPRPGDRVLVFTYLPPVDMSGRVIYGQASKHFIFETADGRLIPPVALSTELQDAGITSLDQLMRRISRDDLTNGGKSRTRVQ